MKAFILAAGRGDRLRPLTDKTPKPLLKAGDFSLIEYHLHNIQAAGISEVVINTAWLGEQIRTTIGDGSRYQLSINHSDEGDEALETAGGIIKALPLLDENPFLVINADIWTDYDLTQLVDKTIDTEAHLVLVDNPPHNSEGDFSLSEDQLSNIGDHMLTYSGIGIYTRKLFEDYSFGKRSLAPILREKIDANHISAEHYHGQWTDVGTVERLNELHSLLTK